MKPLIIRGIWLFLAAWLVARPASASGVDVRWCARLTEPAQAELAARARLLLLGAGLDGAHVAVRCDASTAWLVWVDGGKTPIDEASGIVEGALDAIEDRLPQPKKSARAAKMTASPTDPPAPIAPAPGWGRGPPVAGEDPTVPKFDQPEPSAPRSDQALEGGIGLGMATEVWDGSLLMGPRLDVGIAVGRKLAFVIGEGARFGLGTPDLGQVMVFDLQAGIAFGAPYQARSAFGAVLLAGAERLAVSAGRFAEGGVWTWSGTLSLGGRASLALGPMDAWIGVEAILRSTTIQTDGPSGVSIPALSGLVSVGAFLPAFSRAPAPPSQVSLAREP